MLKKDALKNSALTLGLVAILLFSGFVYFYNLGEESLTTDEYFSLYSAQLPWHKIIFGHQKEYDPNTLPPLYHLIMHFWLKVFGSGEYAQRSFSAILGVLSVWMLYALTRLLIDRRTAVLSALFGAFSFSWFYLFRSNRCYGLFIFLTLLSFYIFYYYLKNKKSRVAPWVFMLTNISLLYTHYFSFFIIALELIFTALEWENDKEWAENVFIMSAWVFITYVPWYDNLFYDINREPALNKEIPHFGWGAKIHMSTIALFSDFHCPWQPFLTIIYLPFVFAGYKKLLANKSTFARHLPLYLVLTLSIPFIIIYSFTPINRQRYFAPFSFPLIMLLALGISSIGLKRFKKILFILLLSSICAVNLMDFYDFFHAPLNENWKKAALYIKQVPDYQNKEMVFAFQTLYNPPVFAYYYWGKDAAGLFINNISSRQDYKKVISKLDPKHKVYFWKGINAKSVFEKLSPLPDNAWVWIFMYHNKQFPSDFLALNKNRYSFQQIILNPELPQIDFYLLKKRK